MDSEDSDSDNERRLGQIGDRFGPRSRYSALSPLQLAVILFVWNRNGKSTNIVQQTFIRGRLDSICLRLAHASEPAAAAAGLGLDRVC